MFNPWFVVASLSGAAAVALGAYGAHGLAEQLPARQLASWQTAVQYHLVHSVALLALASIAARGDRRVRLPAWSFSLGIALFSGSLYGLALGGHRWLGPLTPIGGVCLIAGWLALLPLAPWRKQCP